MNCFFENYSDFFSVFNHQLSRILLNGRNLTHDPLMAACNSKESTL